MLQAEIFNMGHGHGHPFVLWLWDDLLNVTGII